MNKRFFLQIFFALVIVVVFSQIPSLTRHIKHLAIADTKDDGAGENPFAIAFPAKKNLTHADYLTVQKLLKSINLDPFLHELYVPNQNYTTFDDLKMRCCNGLNQVLIDPEKGLFPIKRLEKIGKGSDMCLVCCIPYNKKYASLITSIPDALKESGFNGYFYYRIGGYPNPTGKEIQYAGVPYAFKIFLMLEAQQLGFNKVIWIDSALLPLCDPTPLFTQLEEKGSFLLDFRNDEFEKRYIIDDYNKRYIFPKTRELLKQLTSIDVVSKKHILTQIFGLKMDTEKTKNFIEQYYKFVSLGTPFCSCFPEEFVFSSIIEQSPSDWFAVPHFKIITYSYHEDLNEINEAKKLGYFFYCRHH